MKFMVEDTEYDVRFAVPDCECDRTGFRQLWETCFDDTPKFVDFFFHRRYYPEYSVCVTHHGKIVAIMQSMPVHLRIRQALIPAAIVAGVCTHPDHRGRGLMRRMFAEYLPGMRRLGITAITYRPVDFAIYRSLGHLPATRTLRLTAPSPVPVGIRGFDIVDGLLQDLPEDRIRAAFELYSLCSANYSGIVARTYPDFLVKRDDYAASDARAAFVSYNGGVTGYCFYFSTPTEIYGEELFALTDDAELALLDHLAMACKGRSLTVKLAPGHGQGDGPFVLQSMRGGSLPHAGNRTPDGTVLPLASLFGPGSSVPLAPQNALGITSIPEFLRLLKLERFVSEPVMTDFVIELTDPMHEEHCRAFALHGSISSKPPLAKVDVGPFVQFLCGYLSAEELFEIADAYSCLLGSVNAALKKEICFIVDEY